MVVTTDLLVALGSAAGALWILVAAAEAVIDRLLAIAGHYDVPDVLVAMSIIAIGTSLPEIAAHVTASIGIISGTLDPTIAAATVLGGNVGSSTVQQILLVGLFLIGYGRVEVSRSFIEGVYGPMLVALALLLVLAWDGTISRFDAVVLVAVYLLYVGFSIERRPRSVTIPDGESRNVSRDAIVVVAGLILIVASAFVVLVAVQGLVTRLGLGGSMIGVITIGIAAALPELSTVIESIRRRAPTLALGTLFGSNVVNSLLAVGLGGAVSTYRVPRAITRYDLPFKLVVGLGLLGYLALVSGYDLRRRDGFYLVVLYLVYVSLRLLVYPSQ